MSLLMVRKSALAHAADAYIDDITYKYKVGDKIKTPDGVGIVQKKTHTNSGKPAYEVKLDKGGIVVHVEQSISAANDSAATDGAGYSNYANARSSFAKALFSATSAAMEILSAASGFEKDPQYNKEFEKMVKADTDFARKLIALKNQYKI